MPNNANAQGNQANGSTQQNPNQSQNNGQGQGNNTQQLYTEDEVMAIINRDAATVEEAKENSRMWMTAALVGTALMRFAPHPGVKAFGFGFTLVSLAKASRSLDGE